MLSTRNVSQSVRSALAAAGFGLVSGLFVTFPVVLAAERATGLEQQLIELGWSSYQASDGTVTLTPPTGKASAEKGRGRVTSPASSNSFHQKLLRLGWRLEEQSDGTLVFFPPPAVQAKPQRDVSENVDKPVEGSSDSSMLAVEKLLAGPGWKVEEDLDGTTRLIPAAALQLERVSEPGTQATVTNPSLASDIRTKLENQGWTSTRSEDGTITLVSPPAQQGTEFVGERHEAAAPETKAGMKSTALAPELRKKLESRGWKLMENPDGSIVLFPPSAQGVGERVVPEQPSSEPVVEQPDSIPMLQEAEVAGGWWIADTIRDNTLKLPVDTWAEAQSIAQSWISHEAGSDLRTGKIRKIVRVYVISIVEDQSPYKLRHQLAVRAEDGHLAVLY